MLWWLAQNTLTALVLALAVALVSCVGRLSPATRHALWLLVLLKLLTPPVVTWPWALPAFVSTVEQTAVSESTALGPVVPGIFETLDVEDLSGELAAEQPSETTCAPSTPPMPTAVRLSWSPIIWLYVIWLSGVIVACALDLTRIVHFHRRLRGARTPPAWLLHQVAEIADRLGVRTPKTRMVAGLGSPFIWGLGRPQLLWPATLSESLPLDRRRSILAHELAHLKRRDHWVGWLQLIAGCLWWWNPLFWYVRRELRWNAELACDAWVVAVLPGTRRAYAEALLDVVQLVSRTRAPVPALGMSSGARRAFERRLVMIMRECVPPRIPVRGLLAIGCLGLLALPGWSQLPAPAPKDNPSAPGESSGIVVQPADIIYFLQRDEKQTEPVRTTLRLATVAPQNASTSSSSDNEREQRLRALEQQLQAMLKEIKALRQEKTGTATPRSDTQRVLRLTGSADNKPVTAAQKVLNEYAIELTQQPGQQAIRRLHVNLATPEGQTVVLVRSTYKLSHAAAESLAAMLREHVKAPIFETKVEGDTLIVTTTAQAQEVIKGLVALIKGKLAAAPQEKLHELTLQAAPEHLQRTIELAPLRLEKTIQLAPAQLRRELKLQTAVPAEIQVEPQQRKTPPKVQPQER
jgi:beta-lactamase regulating signal transducer with metallopeptidase domain